MTFSMGMFRFLTMGTVLSIDNNCQFSGDVVITSSSVTSSKTKMILIPLHATLSGCDMFNAARILSVIGGIFVFIGLFAFAVVASAGGGLAFFGCTMIWIGWGLYYQWSQTSTLTVVADTTTVLDLSQNYYQYGFWLLLAAACASFVGSILCCSAPAKYDREMETRVVVSRAEYAAVPVAEPHSV